MSTAILNEETEISQEITTINKMATGLVVKDNSSYEAAAAFGSNIKKAIEKVVAFFEPMKTAAHKAHREICAREKEMLKPLTEAETVLKTSMGTYLAVIEEERRKAQEEAERLANEEYEKAMAEAIAHEEAGETDLAEAAMQDAELAETMSKNVYVHHTAPKAAGASTSTDWEITNIDDEKVPVTLNGIVLRPVDEKGILRLIRNSKGKVQIPGITYKSKPKIALRK